jgi:hypothetical protein
VQRLGSDVVVTVRHPLAVVSSWRRLESSFDFANLLEQSLLMRDLLGPVENEMRAALVPSADVIDRVALLWRIVYQTVAQLREELPGLLVVRHEDLSRAPSERFRALFDALGLTYAAEAIEAVAASTSRENPAGTPIDQPHETRINSLANLENWRLRLTPDEVGRIRSLTESAAAVFYTDDEWR